MFLILAVKYSIQQNTLTCRFALIYSPLRILFSENVQYAFEHLVFYLSIPQLTSFFHRQFYYPLNESKGIYSDSSVFVGISLSLRLIFVTEIFMGSRNSSDWSVISDHF